MVPHMNIGEHGHIALILDTEGNQVGLHANAE
jgi:predicted enzyme related to lactoylglutathione lyase